MRRLKLCSSPGCRVVLTGKRSRCPAHSATLGGPNKKVRDPFLDSKAWRDLSSAVARRSPLCAECLRRGRIRQGTQRDHILSRRSRPDLALEPTNVENLCDCCHGMKTRRGE